MIAEAMFAFVCLFQSDLTSGSQNAILIQAASASSADHRKKPQVCGIKDPKNSSYPWIVTILHMTLIQAHMENCWSERILLEALPCGLSDLLTALIARVARMLTPPAPLDTEVTLLRPSMYSFP